MKYYFKKHRIKIFFLLVLSLIVFGCSFLIKEVNVKQENEAGEMVAYIKAGEIATFTFSGEINIDGDASNETFIVGFLAPRSWNVRQNATVTYGEVTRRAALLEQLQQEYHVIVTGPTTLAAILNSLQIIKV